MAELWGSVVVSVLFCGFANQNLGPGVDGWAVSLKGMMSIVVLMGFDICGCYWWVNTFVPLPLRSSSKKKVHSDLETLVVAYGISINLVEVTWKSKLKAQMNTPKGYGTD
ncbi:hypothetical protein QQ045_016533 [Rhodiola kirilowii]